MNPKQREAAERLIGTYKRNQSPWDAEVVALLRELLAEPQGEPAAWLVMSDSGPVYAAAWEQGAHDHINDALMRDEIGDLEDVKSWRVVPVYASPQPQQTEPSQDTPPQQVPRPNKLHSCDDPLCSLCGCWLKE